MKNKLAFLFCFTLSFAFGQSNYRVSNYSLVIKGTSNLHEWQSNANEVRANGGLTIDATGLKAIPWFNVEVPVKSIKSPKGSIMDNKTYDALKADNYPNIFFKLDRVGGINNRGGNYEVNLTGTLSMAGASKQIDLYVQGRPAADGSVVFSGSKKLKMTDYGIKPPTALMGTLTTGDEVEIVFQITMRKL